MINAWGPAQMRSLAAKINGKYSFCDSTAQTQNVLKNPFRERMPLSDHP